MAHPFATDKDKLEKSPDREPNNVYPTPQIVADAFTKFVLDDFNFPFSSDPMKPYLQILDPGCGEGIFGKSVRTWENSVSWRVRAEIKGWDIRPDLPTPDAYNDFIYDDIFGGDETFFQQDPHAMVLGNPPYHKSWHIMVKWLVKVVTTYRYVGLLMPTDWRHGLARKTDLFDIRMPKYVLDSSRRIDFTGNKAQTRNFAFWYWDYRWDKEFYMGIPIDYKE